MKPHLPLVLLSALIFSHSPVLAIAPSDTAIDLSTGNVSLEGGKQTGEITGTGDLTIASGTVRISSKNDDTNIYSGETIVNSGATLSFEKEDFKGTSLHQLGDSTLTLNGTLKFSEGNTWQADTFTIGTTINLKNGALITSDDGNFAFTGGLNLDLQQGESATIKMAWGKTWKLDGIISGQGTLNLTCVGGDARKVFEISGASNTFSGIYNVDSKAVGDGADDYLALSLKNENAAKGATINLAGKEGKSFLVLNDMDATIGGLTGNGRVRNGSVTTGGFTESSTSRTLTVNQTNAGTDTFNGALDSKVNLTKTGVGTLTLTNLAGYTGTLGVQGGTLSLKLANASIYNLSNVTGTGGKLHLESGTFSIGGTEIGTTNLGGATLSANGASLLIDIKGNQSDKISFAGALTGTFNIDFNIVGASLDQKFTFMTTDSADNALNSLSALGNLTRESQFYTGTILANGNDIQFHLTGYSQNLLQWNGGAEGTWTNNGDSWLANGGTGASFDSSKSVLFGEQATPGNAIITLDTTTGIKTAGVLIESDHTHYTLQGGSLETEVFVKNGSSTAILDLVYKISTLRINEGSLELRQAAVKDTTLTILGGGTLNVNWEENDISNVVLTGHEGALTLTKGGIRTNLLDIVNAASISMKGGKIFLSDTGNITLAIKNSISVSETGSEINRVNRGDITWNTALTGNGTLTLNLDGTLNLENNTASFTNFDGTLAVNGNINVSGSNTFKNTASLTLGEGKTLTMTLHSQLQGLDSVTLSKNTNVKMDNGTLSATTIALDAEGGSVTFSAFQSGDSTLSGKITGTAGQLIFHHNTHGNTLNHSNWAGSNYTGTTIFKATTENGGSHNYQVEAGATGVITPWGDVKNLVQIGSADSISTVNVKFSGLNASGSVSIGNNIELITGSGSDKNSILDFTSGSYNLTGDVTIKNGANGANKAIIQSSGTNLTLSGKLIGDTSSVLNFEGTGKSTISGNTSAFHGKINANVGNFVLVNGALANLTNDRLTVGLATKINLILNGDNNNDANYLFTQPIASLAMQGGKHTLTMAKGSTINAFTQTGTSSNLTLNGAMSFDTMKIGIEAKGNGLSNAGTLNIAGSVTTGSFQGATEGNARYTLNLEDGGSLIVTGESSDKASASMILAIKGYGETDRPTTEVTTFNMNGGELKVEKATMFFADDGHVTWNMKGGKATLLGLDMTSDGSKTTKLALTGGEIAIGANGLTANNSDKNTIELGNGTLSAYESWTTTANMQLTNAVEGTKIKAEAGKTMTLSGIISDKSGVNGKLVKTGEGELIMNGANTYSGGTQITAGTATAGNAKAFGIGAISVSGGKLDANGQKLGNSINITSGTISNLGSTANDRKAIAITPTTDSTIAIDKSFVSVTDMNTATNQKITLGNGSDMLVTGNSTFVVSSENISANFASKGECIFSVSSDSALVINGTLTLDFTADAFKNYTEAGTSVSINLFALLAGGNLDLDALTKIVFKTDGDKNPWLTLDKDTQSEIFKDLASTGSIDLSFTGVPPIGPITPGEAVPEPSSTGLALLGAAGLLLRRRRRQAV